MLSLFGHVWWNYDHLRFNYKGILSLQSSIGWGCLAIIVFGFLNKAIEGVVCMIPTQIADVVGLILVVAYVVDFTTHFSRKLNEKGLDEDTDEIEEVEHHGIIARIRNYF